MNKLEIYGIVLAVLILAGASAYFKGRSDERDAFQQKALAANATKMAGYESTQMQRATADDAARDKALKFVDDISKRMDGVNAKFSKLPNIVVDARGCEHLTDAARVRWNAIELVPTGPAVHETLDAAGPVRPAEVPAAR